jgi:type IV secretion system protein VirD4
MNRVLFRLLLVLHHVMGGLLLHRHLHVARFARLDELATLASPRPRKFGLLLGRTRFRHLLHVTPTKTRRELGNVLIVAPTRGGKGLLATSQLLSWKHSVIVNDIKGELFAQTAGYRSTLGKVFVIDPGGVGHRYDPLQGKRSEDALLSVATNLLHRPDEGEGEIFTRRATNMLTQLFLGARRAGHAPLPYTRHLLRCGLPGVVEQLHGLDPVLATQFLDVPYEQVNYEDRFLLSAWSTLTARLKPLLTETVVRCFAGSDFEVSDLLRSKSPVTVYLRWPERDLLALSPLVRLLWGSFIDELITTYDSVGGRDCQPVLLLVDEAGRTAIPGLADYATTVVGRGITLWIAIQSLSQLEAIYGQARAEILRDNMETQLYYRPANQATAEYLERCLGKRSAYAESHTTRHGQESSEGRSEQGVPLLTAWEIKQLHDEQIIGFHRRLPPFRAHRMDWRDIQTLVTRHGLTPPVLPSLPGLEEMVVPVGGEVFSSPYVDPDGFGVPGKRTGSNR